MEYIGYLSSILIGVILGLIGSGGSILTIPVLVYLFSVDVVLATTYSLLIVGVTSAIGSMNYLRRNLVNRKLVILFGLPSVVSVLVTRAFLLPAIPTNIVSVGSLEINKSLLLLLFFAVLMIVAAIYMIWKPREIKTKPGSHTNGKFGRIIFQGMAIGLVTGLVGAGGGFLIVPSLIIFQKLSIKEAIGTSLVIIATNALLGFIGTPDKSNIDWQFLMLISMLAITGIFIGMRLSKRVDQATLKPAFGCFVLLMGLYIILREIFFVS